MKNLLYSTLFIASCLGFICLASQDKSAGDKASAHNTPASNTDSSHDGHDHGAEGHDHSKETGDDHAGHNHDVAGDDGHDHSSDVTITVPQAAQYSLALTYEKVSEKTSAPMMVIFGQLQIPSRAMVSYSLPIGGQIEPIAKPAQTVKQGDTLFSINSPELVGLYAAYREATAEQKRAEAELETLRTRINNLRALNTKNAELETTYLSKQAELDALNVKVDSSLKQFTVASGGGEFIGGQLVFRAKINGTVEGLTKSVGAWGQQGEEVMTIIPQNQLEFFGLTYSGIDLKNTTAQLVLRDQSSTERLDGTLRISGNVNTEKSTREVYFEPAKIPSPAYAGQQAQLEIYSTKAQNEGYYYVPQGAVVRMGIDDVVFVKDPKNSEFFVMKKVSILPTKHGLTPVKGLHVGDNIVIRGANELKYAVPSTDGAKKKAAGHFHADGKFHEGEH